MVYYPKPMHMQQAFDGLVFNDKDYVNTIQLCDTVLSLPMHPYLENTDMNKVVEVIKQYKSRV